MPRPLTPIWLATPSRFAGVPKRRAAIVAILLASLLIAAFTALAAPRVATDPTARFGDLILYEGVIAGIGAGGDYYQLTADALRAGGEPLRPFTAFRLPTHAVVQAVLPPIVTFAMLSLLALGVAVAWWVRLMSALARPPARIAAMILLAGGMVVFVQAGLASLHEIWAAQLIALALAIRRPGRWVEAAALALVAMLVRETAALFAIVMLLAAWRDDERREAAGWAVALLAFVLAIVAHAWAVAQIVGPLDPAAASAAGWLGPAGVVRSVIEATSFQLLPLALAAPLVALALFGWVSWRDALASRAFATFAAYALLIAILAQPGTLLGMLIAPVFLVGLAFAPDGVRDLAAALLDRRRVRVQRITQ